LRDTDRQAPGSRIPGPRPRAKRLRQPEVQHLDSGIGSQLDVGRLQVAVDDALLVSGLERLGNLSGDGERLVHGERAFLDPVCKCRPLDQLHHERRLALGSFQPVDLRNVGVVQGGSGPFCRMALSPRFTPAASPTSDGSG